MTRNLCGLQRGHVEELMAHWMTTGSLDYPFATVGNKVGGRDIAWAGFCAP
jgi:hypothetical protein